MKAAALPAVAPMMDRVKALTTVRRSMSEERRLPPGLRVILARDIRCVISTYVRGCGLCPCCQRRRLAYRASFRSIAPTTMSVRRGIEFRLESLAIAKNMNRLRASWLMRGEGKADNGKVHHDRGCLGA